MPKVRKSRQYEKFQMQIFIDDPINYCITLYISFTANVLKDLELIFQGSVESAEI